LFLFCEVLLAQNKKSSEWIDTIPPIVKIQPKDTFHSNFFHITFEVNEIANVWYKILSSTIKAEKHQQYKTPITITEDGELKIFYYAEDLVGNKSKEDSMKYVLDTKPPELSIYPEPGRFRKPVSVILKSNEPCKYFYIGSLIEPESKLMPLKDTLVVKDSLSGYFVAVDRAGNKTFSKKMTFVIDSTVIDVEINPKEGIFNTRKEISFKAVPPCDVFYTFDPFIPAKLFEKYQKPVLLPYGTTIVRYYAKNSLGWESEIKKSTFIVDTIPPKIKFERFEGTNFDTLVLSTRKNAVIRYTLNNIYPTESSNQYTGPIVVQRKSRCILKAIAFDIAGNKSDLFEWQYIYDKNPPVITLSKPSGVYNGPFKLYVNSNKPSTIFYTLDGSSPNQNSLMYKDGITITKEGITKIKLKAIDDAGNTSPEIEGDYIIDTKPPSVKVRIEEDTKGNLFWVSLIPDEDADIFYEIDAFPNQMSSKYKERISVKIGQILRYFAIDRAGNKTEIKSLDELKRPMVSVSPPGGIYRRAVNISFSSSAGSLIFWRILPDTVFYPSSNIPVLSKEGSYTLEYYSEDQNGLKSPLRRAEYILDLTIPKVNVIVKKGNKDSINVFFEANKNVSIYYTTDGTNPAFSATTHVAGNKLTSSKDRITIPKKTDLRLAFYAEDAAGNQSPIRVINLLKPIVMSDIPSGTEHIYDHVLNVNLFSFDAQSIIYYKRKSENNFLMYSSPLTILKTDTIIVFAFSSTGEKGDLDTLVFLIDFPPLPNFLYQPKDPIIGEVVSFDASSSEDAETPKEKLLYRWDLNGDGIFDTDFSSNKIVSFNFQKAGYFDITLEVKDLQKRISSITKKIKIQPKCPNDMIAIFKDNGDAFCIDKYEFPNAFNQMPLSNVSWVQAKLNCMDIGKRLCTYDEWVSACKTYKKNISAYDSKLKKSECAASAKSVQKSGSFLKCGNQNGPQDMVGNLWEWVEDKVVDYPLIAGGSFAFSESSDCFTKSQASVGLKSGEVGFRCCK